MQIQQIRIEGFGTLSDLTIPGLAQGLNVIYGVNGAGKTTIVHFLRGVLTGFEEARRLRLLPPLKNGRPGGSATLQTEKGRFEIIRHHRADQSDTFAVQLLKGEPNEVTALRGELSRLQEQHLTSVFTVGGAAAHDLDALVLHARQAGMNLSSKREQHRWIDGRLQTLQEERSDLFDGLPSRGKIPQGEQTLLNLGSQLIQSQKTQSDRIQNWHQGLADRKTAVTRIQAEVDWLCQELQAVESDLTEIQNRLWSRKTQTIEEQFVETESVQKVVAVDNSEIDEIDRAIAHAQQVLRDLAASRLSLSLAKVDLSTSVVIDEQEHFQKMRQALSSIETESAQIRQAAASMRTSPLFTERDQDRSAAGLEKTAQAILEQIWHLCQLVSRQQTAYEESLLLTQRDGIDRCELELTRQIQRLRIRREAALSKRSSAATLGAWTEKEQQLCECETHRAGVQHLKQGEVCHTIVQQPVTKTRTRIVETSAARPQDAQRYEELQARRVQLRSQWLAAMGRLRSARAEVERFENDCHAIAEDRSVQSLRYEHAVVEQKLADDREQWQSLALLQMVLQKTQEKLQVEVLSPLMEEASDYLSRMTNGRFTRFRYCDETQEMRIVNTSGAELPSQALSRGTLEQATLSFRLALCREYHRRGIDFPLFLDEALVDSDEGRLQLALNVLVDFAREHQVVVLSCQEHLVRILEGLGGKVQFLPGSHYQPLFSLTVNSVVEEEPVPQSLLQAETKQTVDDDHKDEVDILLDRIQPDEPYWLQVHAPVNYVPSLGSQMARRLGALGVRSVQDLIDLDPEIAEIPLQSLQISAITLRYWQAEARLLCCVPDLTGRDAQLLVRCGIESPIELAECDLNDLVSRILSFRNNQSSEFALTWMNDQTDWPNHQLINRWIRRGKKSRTLGQAREWSNRHRNRLTPRQKPFQEQRLTVVPNVSFEPDSTEIENAESSKELRYFLQIDSPIVDAPSIGPKTAQLLEAIGIVNVTNLINRSADEIARGVKRRHITAEVVTAWQQQALLVCHVPELRGHDAQVLVACGITQSEQLAQSAAEDLYAKVRPFVRSREGQRMLRSAKTPDLAEVRFWIENAQQGLFTRAA